MPRYRFRFTVFAAKWVGGDLLLYRASESGLLSRSLLKHCCVRLPNKIRVSTQLEGAVSIVKVAVRRIKPLSAALLPWGELWVRVSSIRLHDPSAFIPHVLAF